MRNPEEPQITSQIEGCTVMALSGALFEEVKFKDGKVLAVDQHRLRSRRVAEARHAVIGEARVEDLADLFGEQVEDWLR